MYDDSKSPDYVSKCRYEKNFNSKRKKAATYRTEIPNT